MEVTSYSIIQSKTFRKSFEGLMNSDLTDAFALSMQTIIDRETKKLFTGNWLEFDEDNWPIPPDQQDRKTIDLSPDEYREVQDMKELPDANQ